MHSVSAGCLGRVGLFAAVLGAGALLAFAPAAQAEPDATRGSGATASSASHAPDRGPASRVSRQAHVPAASARRAPTKPAFAQRPEGRAVLSAPSPTGRTQAAPTAATTPARTSLTVVDGVIKGNADRFHLLGTTTLTVVDKPSAGGKITPLTREDPGYTPGAFTYLPDVSVLSSAQREQFSILATYHTGVSDFLQKLPAIGPVVFALQEVPIVNTLLAPIIGYTRLSNFDSSMVRIPAGVPVAYTAMVTSFDGTPISTNFFPASTRGPDGVPVSESAPTILFGPGLNGAGWTNPYGPTGWMLPLVGEPRTRGYNVITWDPRGMGDSGGVMHWDSPAYEGRDVIAILDWAQGISATGENNLFAAKVGSKFGMTGASYGGAIQLVTAALDDRIKAIVPVATWNSLTRSFYPDGAYKTAYDFVIRSTSIDPGITVVDSSGVAVAINGVMSDAAFAELAASGPSWLVGDIRTPTLLIQGTVDTLFPLEEAMITERTLAANGVPVKSIWFCGGHGDCLDPSNRSWDVVALNSTMAWLDQYVKGDGTPADSVPAFQYVDQRGDFYRSDLLPTDPDFNSGVVTAHGAGGSLVIEPLTGGSGPVHAPDGRPVTLPNAGGAWAPNAITVTVPASSGTRYIAGAPQLTFSYSGTGDARFVYAQLVDNTTGLVLGNMVTPIAVTLDGRQHEVAVSMDAIAYTQTRKDSITLQITSSATEFARIPQSGEIVVSTVALTLPTTTAVTKVPCVF